MNNMIKEILETDRAARLEVEQAAKRREELAEELNCEKEAYDDKYRNEAHQKIEGTRKRSKEQLAKAQEKLAAETLRKKEELQRNFDENHKKWEKEILKNIFG